jgi:ferredoxin
MSIRVIVDRDLCEGNARCVQLAPNVFEVGDDDKLRVLIERPGATLRDKVEAAVALCPRQALSLVDE